MLTIEDIERFEQDIMEARKPKPTVSQMVDDFAETMRQEKNPYMSSQLICEEYDEWDCEAIRHPWEPEKELKELSDLVYVIYSYARVRGWDLQSAIERVHSNNMQRCIWSDGSVRYREDGKVMKNPDAPKVDLSDLVGK